MPQKKDPSLPVALVAIIVAATALILTIVWRDADDVRFVPRDQYTTTTIVVTLPDGG